jgi:hypothetical protein
MTDIYLYIHIYEYNEISNTYLQSDITIKYKNI